VNLRHVLLLGVCSTAALDESILLGRADREAPHCRKVKAAVAVVSTSENCTSPIAFCSTGTVSAGGMLNGAFAGTVLALAPAAGLPAFVPAATVSFVANHAIETPRGTLSMVGTGVFDTARGVFAEADPITGGTGVFAGATGTLWLTGTSPDGGATFAGDVTGEVCVAR
jgi:hypothetical protein